MTNDRSDTPSLSGEREALANLLDAAAEYISVKEGLLAHHRAGSPPSEAFWKRRDKAQLRWEWARTQANIALGRLSEAPHIGRSQGVSDDD